MEAAGTSRSGSACSAAGSSSKLLFKAYDELWTLNGRTVLVSSLSLPLQAGRIRAAPYVQVTKTRAGKQMKPRASLLIWIWPRNWTTVKLVCKIFPICIAVRGFLRTLEDLAAEIPNDQMWTSNSTSSRWNSSLEIRITPQTRAGDGGLVLDHLSCRYKSHKYKATGLRSSNFY